MRATPAARFWAILRSSWAKAYGGIFSRRLLGFIQLLFELVTDLAGEHGTRPACQIHPQVLPHLDQQLTAVEPDRDLTGSRVSGLILEVGDGGPGRAGARSERLPHPTLEDPGADRAAR